MVWWRRTYILADRMLWFVLAKGRACLVRAKRPSWRSVAGADRAAVSNGKGAGVQHCYNTPARSSTKTYG